MKKLFFLCVLPFFFCHANITVIAPDDAYCTTYAKELVKFLNKSIAIQYVNYNGSSYGKTLKKLKNLCSWLPSDNIILFINDFENVEKKKALAYLPMNSLKIALITSTRKISDISVKCLKSLFDIIIVTDKISYKKLQEEKSLKTPIFYQPTLKVSFQNTYSTNIEKKEKFIFLSCCSCNKDNQHADLIKAFHKQFGDNSSVQLHIIFKDWEPSAVREVIALQDKLGVENILVSQETNFKPQYFDICSCYVGLSDVEVDYSFYALAIGLPVLTKENLSYGMMLEIPGKFLTPSWDSSKINYNFYHCKKSDIGKALKDIYINYSTYLQQVKMQQDKLKQANEENKKILLNFLVPKNVTFGEKNESTSNSITTNSMRLYKRLLKHKT